MSCPAFCWVLMEEGGEGDRGGGGGKAGEGMVTGGEASEKGDRSCVPPAPTSPPTLLCGWSQELLWSPRQRESDAGVAEVWGCRVRGGMTEG